MNPVTLINQTNGRFFQVTFIKRDGTTRHMTARLGVRKHVRGTGMAYSPRDKGLMTVWDTVKKEYRMIPTVASRILSFKCGKLTWRAV